MFDSTTDTSLSTALLLSALTWLITACAGPSQFDALTEDRSQSTVPSPPPGVFFIHARDLPPRSHALSFGLPAQVLRDNPTTGSALLLDIPSAWSSKRILQLDHALEIYVLAGDLTLDDQQFEAEDFLRVPAGGSVTVVASSEGARILLFADPLLSSTNSESVEHQIVRRSKVDWIPGTAMRDAGRDDVPLEILHLQNHPDTGARTYLVRVKPGLTIPWEVHKVAEEAFVIEGDFTLAECLDGEEHVFEYLEGGYFYRPAGIAHNGPQSGSRSGVVMLIRTPGPLTVELVDGCR